MRWLWPSPLTPAHRRGRRWLKPARTRSTRRESQSGERGAGSTHPGNPLQRHPLHAAGVIAADDPRAGSSVRLSRAATSCRSSCSGSRCCSGRMPRASFLTSISTNQQHAGHDPTASDSDVALAAETSDELPRGIGHDCLRRAGRRDDLRRTGGRPPPIRGRNCASRSASTCRCSTKHSPRPRCRRYLPTSNSPRSGTCRRRSRCRSPTTGRPCGTSGMNRTGDTSSLALHTATSEPSETRGRRTPTSSISSED